MKKDRIYIILVLLCLLFVTGCDKMLETKSQTLLPQDKLQTEAGCEAMLYGVYDLMQETTFYGRDIFLRLLPVIRDKRITVSVPILIFGWNHMR